MFLCELYHTVRFGAVNHEIFPEVVANIVPLSLYVPCRHHCCCCAAITVAAVPPSLLLLCRHHCCCRVAIIVAAVPPSLLLLCRHHCCCRGTTLPGYVAIATTINRVQCQVSAFIVLTIYPCL